MTSRPASRLRYDHAMSDATLPPDLSAAHDAPDRNLALELVRVTEAAAMAAGRWVGRGDKNGADGVAVNAMRVLISTVGMQGTVVIGEGEKDNAPMLFNGEEVGDGTGPECDVAVDPIDGTTLTAKGMNNAIAVLLRGGSFPLAYAYPPAWRATRDLLRRRNHLMRKRAELLAHIQNTATQYNLPALGKKIAHKTHRQGVAEHFPHPEVRKSIEVDLALLDHYDELLRELELHLARTAKVHDAQVFYLLRSIPGVGKILALVLMYEIYDVERFPSVQDFTSYCRLVKPSRTSAGKNYGTSGKKIGNPHLKWAFSEAAQLFLRGNEAGQRYFHRLESKYGKGKALSVRAHKLGRALYQMLRRKEAFDMTTFLSQA